MPVQKPKMKPGDSVRHMASNPAWFSFTGTFQRYVMCAVVKLPDGTLKLVPVDAVERESRPRGRPPGSGAGRPNAAGTGRGPGRPRKNAQDDDDEVVPEGDDDSFYQHALAVALTAANEAGEKWVNDVRIARGYGPGTEIPKGAMFDCCGFSYLVWTDKRSKFFRWTVKAGICTKGDYALRINHKYRGQQDMGLLEACNRAALAVLRELIGEKNVSLQHTSRVD